MLRQIEPCAIPGWRKLLATPHMFYGWAGIDGDAIYRLFPLHRTFFSIDSCFGLKDLITARIKDLERVGTPETNERALRDPAYRRLTFSGYVRNGFKRERCRFKQKDFESITLCFQKRTDGSGPEKFTLIYQIRDAIEAWYDFYEGGGRSPTTLTAIHPCEYMPKIMKMVSDLHRRVGVMPEFLLTHDPKEWLGQSKYENIGLEKMPVLEFLSNGPQCGERYLLRFIQ